MSHDLVNIVKYYSMLIVSLHFVHMSNKSSNKSKIISRSSLSRFKTKQMHYKFQTKNEKIDFINEQRSITKINKKTNNR